MAGAVGWIVVKLLATIGTLFPTIRNLMSSGSVASSSSTATDPVQALARLKRMMLRIQAVLHDAEEREIRDESVKLWLKEIKEVAYDAEDVLDEYEYELQRYQIEGRAAPESEASSSSSSSSSRKRKLQEMEKQVCGSTSTSCSLNSLMIARELADNVNKINERFDEIAKDRDALHLKEEDGSRRKDDCMIPQPTGPYVDESGIYGREEEMAKIVDLLLSGDEKFTVLAIVGMGGLGKTTLAQLVYNNERINQFFNLKGWVSVSVNFDVVRLNRAIIESFTGESCNLIELSALQNIIKEKIKDKRVLLVLDDIWNEKQNPWDLLKAPLLQAKQTKILMTTRNDSVASIMQTMTSYHLDFLSEEKSWVLFQRHAFADQDFMEHSNLMDIGMRIVKKCGGLPLALKVVGGLLRHKEANEESWEDILQSNLWELDKTQNQILPALRLSYFYMPTYLKPCFFYCSLFPKSSQIEIDQIIRLWMAQGYIIQSREKESAEDIGRDYVEQLHRRSLLQFQVWDSCHEYFHMHDLVHDLASSVSGKEFHQIISVSDIEDIPGEIRHLYINIKQEIDSRQLLSRLPKALRTLVYCCQNPALIVNHLFLLEDLRCLRALDLDFKAVAMLPYSIGNLKRLRYLKVRYVDLQKSYRLPESVGQLYNLQVLDLDPSAHCYLRRLPSGIVNLVNLRFLGGVGTCMPRGIGKLTNLQTLEYFNMGRGAQHCGIEELKGLVNLRGHLSITGLRNVTRMEDAREANLQSKQRIETLELEWGDGGCERQHGDDEVEEEAGGIGEEEISDAEMEEASAIGEEKSSDAEMEEASAIGEEESRDAELEAAVLDSLCPCTNLTELHIMNYYGARFPCWLGDPSFSRLTTVTLFGIQNCECLPALGQLPSLGGLTIEGMQHLRKMGREFCCSVTCEDTTTESSFPSLKLLHFEDMPEWEEWCGVGDGDFPCLSVLGIITCPKMRSLPLHNLSSLRELVLHDCPQHRLSPDSSEPLPPTLEVLEVAGEGLEEAVLDSFRACTNLGMLKIRRYNGARFSSWMGDPSISRLFNVELSIVENCECLPALGQLPSLQWLRIKGMRRLRKMGREFCCSLTCENTTAEGSFPSLTHLFFEDMPEWEEWCGVGDGDFPCLSLLGIIKCPKMRSLPLFQTLSTLQQLIIVTCDLLESVSGLQGLSSLHYLKLEDCPQLRFSTDEPLPPTLQNLTVERCGGLSILPLHHTPTALQDLTIEDCPQLSSLAGGLQALASLKRLFLKRCPKLQIPPSVRLSSIPNEVTIEDCPELMKWCQAQGFTYPVVTPLFHSDCHHSSPLTAIHPK